MICKGGNLVWAWQNLQKLRPLAYDYVRYKNNDGSSVSFWFDDWLGVGNLIYVTWIWELGTLGLCVLQRLLMCLMDTVGRFVVGESVDTLRYMLKLLLLVSLIHNHNLVLIGCYERMIMKITRKATPLQQLGITENQENQCLLATSCLFGHNNSTIIYDLTCIP
ncbi:hypothetical protein YC2023_070857 [Brassica napus]